METLLDASLLTVLISPALYFFLYRPLILHMSRRRRAEEALQKALGELEIHVAERTAALAATNEALRESEERFTTFMNNSPVVAWLKDPATWTYRYINNAFGEVFGITREVISTKTDFDLWPEEVARQLRENDLRVMSSDKTIQTSEDVPLPNGTVHHWLVFKFPLHTPSGKTFLAGTAVDITERKRAEEALKLFRTLVDRSNDAIEVLDPKTGRFLDVNEKACLDLGYSREELLALSVFDIDPTLDQSFFMKAVEDLRKSSVLLWEGIHRRKDSSTFPVEVNIKYIQLGREYIVSVVRDITGRKLAEEASKQAEEALRESELRFRSVWDKGTDGMRITNEEGIVKLVNDAYCKMMEKPREEIEGKPVGIVYEEPEQAEVLQKFQERFRSRNIPSYLDRELVLWNGKRIFLELSNSFIEIPHQPTLSLSVLRDITERKLAEEASKQAEEALKDAEARYRTLFELVPVGLYRTTPAGQILDANPAIIQMLGYPDRETYLKVNAANLYVNSEDRKQWQMLMDSQEIVRDFEEQVRQSNGTVIWVQDNTCAVRDAGGQVLYYEGILQDITQRKKMEEEREKLILELQDALANIKTLSGLVPICASCKKIRDDKGYWNQLEQYIMDHSDAKLSHGICPDCAKKLYPEFFDKLNTK
jgi:PAS domain S-box-containing protein